jgi:NADH-quinone oxidoreductase subunit J
MPDLVLAATTHATIPDIIVFVVASILILAGAIGVVTSRNPVHAALMLVATLFGIAVLFIEQEADFLAAVQVIVYAGAIVVLFLFVIMFLGVDRRENIEAEELRGQRPLALVLVFVAIGSVIALAVSSRWVTGAHTVTIAAHGPKGEVGQLGKSVFTTYLFAFEVTAALLVIAVVGAVVLARRPPTPFPDETESAPDPGDPTVPLDASPLDADAGVTDPDLTVDGDGADAPSSESVGAHAAAAEPVTEVVPGDVGAVEEVAR